MTGKLHGMQVLASWPQIIGPALAAAASPVAIVDDKLVVRAHTWAWVDEIGKLRRELVARVNASLPDDAPKFSTIVVLAPGCTLVHAGRRYVGKGRAS